MHDHLTPLFARLHAGYLDQLDRHHLDRHHLDRHHLDRHQLDRHHLDRHNVDDLRPANATSRLRSDRGQATTEYALVLLAAALVGLLVVGWATAGGGAGKIGQLFDRVIDSVIDRV
jgi:hypothetical protein